MTTLKEIIRNKKAAFGQFVQETREFVEDNLDLVKHYEDARFEIDLLSNENEELRRELDFERHVNEAFSVIMTNQN